MNANSWRTDLAPHRVIIGIALSYIVLNLFLMAGAVPGDASRLVADSETYLQAARALLEHGAFVQFDNPALPETFRAPGYPLFLAGVFWLSGGEALYPVIIVQILLLFLTGLMSRGIVESWLPGYGNVMLALVIFNPSAFILAQIVLADTLMAFFFVASLWAGLSFIRVPTLRTAVAAGIFLGLSSL